MRYPHIFAAVAALVTLTGFAGAMPAQAAGPLECKAPVIGIGFTNDQAVESWQAQVRSSYGSGWDNFGLARNKQYATINLVLATNQSVVANPCRPAKLGIITNLGGLEHSPDFTDNPPPKHDVFGTRGFPGLSVMGDDNDTPSPKPPRKPKSDKFGKLNGSPTIF